MSYMMEAERSDSARGTREYAAGCRPFCRRLPPFNNTHFFDYFTYAIRHLHVAAIAAECRQILIRRRHTETRQREHAARQCCPHYWPGRAHAVTPADIVSSTRQATGCHAIETET